MLHRVVREHLESLLAECAARSATGRGYPAHVEDEFRRDLDCGIVAKGFLRVHCDACQQDELVAFSCKGRLVDERLPYAPYRQWTFSFPWRIRPALAQDGRLLSKVLSICKRKVFANQRKRARRLFGAVSIGLERDPLEVLRMGTLDANKQVVYCRNQRGKVIARQVLVRILASVWWSE